jgi:hypothetical protein
MLVVEADQQVEAARDAIGAAVRGQNQGRHVTAQKLAGARLVAIRNLSTRLRQRG